MTPGRGGPGGEDAVGVIASRFAANSTVLLVSYGFNTVVSAVVAVFLVRYLGGELYGLLTTTYAYLSFFVILTSIGVDTIVQRDVAREPERAAEIVSGAAGLRLLLSVGSMLLSWALLPLMDPTPRLALLVVVATLSLPFSFQGLYLVLYATELRQGLPKLVFGIWSLLLSVLKLVMIGLGAPLEAFVALEAVSAALVFVASVVLGKRTGLHVRPRWAVGEWRRLLSTSWPVAVASTLIQVYLRIDQLMLYRMVGAEEVGLYGVAVRVVELANVAPIVFMGSAFPILARLWMEDSTRLDRATELSFRFMAWVALPAAAYLSWAADPIIPALFGEEFRETTTILRVLAWSMPFAFAGSVLYNRMFASGLQRPGASIAAGAALTNVLLNLALIPGYGGRGAAVATTISYALVLGLALAHPAARSVGAQAARSLLRPLAAALGGLGAVAAIELGFVAGTAAFVVIYAVLMAALREIGREELALLRRVRGG